MIATLSPQPQADVSLGLLKTKLDEQLVDLEIHLRAEQEQQRLGIDQQLDALVLDDLVERRGAFGEFHRVGHAGAAAILDADAQADDRLVRIGDDLMDPGGRGVGDTHRFQTRIFHQAPLSRPGSRPGAPGFI